jgi:outer membrane protein assembly factor BamE
MRRLALPASLSLLAVFAGCSAMQPTTDRLMGVITPYRIDIMQGNVVTKELAALVKPGMSREQVRDLLGSPLLTSAFHADRWDYVFTLRRQLDKLEAPADLPGENDFVASVRPERKGGAEPVLALTDEQKKALPPPVKTETPATTQPQGPARDYPPLEPA